MRHPIWRVLRWLRHTPDRLLHRRRYSRARLAVHALSPRSLLFVCNGNICRSPYAEAAARRALASSSRAPSFGSAGLIGPDRPSPEDAIAAAAERGIDLAAHRSCLVTPELASKAELVLVMNSTQRRRLRGMLQLPARRLMLLGDLDPEPISTRAIPDPERRPIEEFRSCYARIDRCVDTLAEALRASPSVR